MAAPEVKICGLSTAQTVATAIDAGADFVGFVLFPKSPRAVTPEQARALVEAGGATGRSVALVVDATDTELQTIAAKMAPDWIQAHGAETPERVAQIKALTGKQVIKAVAISQASDLARADAFAEVADRLLLDAKPPKSAVPESALPGGNGLCFDWSVVEGWRAPLPWFLAGGLTPETAAEAMERTGAPALDVSSGVEAARGVKSETKIRAFLAAARGSHARTAVSAPAERPAAR